MARVDACWDRLTDAVDELHDLHEVPVAVILDRVGAMVSDETELRVASS